MTWSCKYCDEKFNSPSLSFKANHSRWCNKNPKRNDTKNLKIAQQKSLSQRLGNLKDYNVSCVNCNKDFAVKEREKQFPQKKEYYCSRSCANSAGGNVRAEKYLYGKHRYKRDDQDLKYHEICWKYHRKECIICKENTIVDAHHYDKNHNNNKPENFVPLCPTHHMYVHSRHEVLIKKQVEDYVYKFKQKNRHSI